MLSFFHFCRALRSFPFLPYDPTQLYVLSLSSISTSKWTGRLLLI
jgi:uncharacterized membrane protein YdjX (TVP38/TMEM64 family)